MILHLKFAHVVTRASVWFEWSRHLAVMCCVISTWCKLRGDVAYTLHRGQEVSVYADGVAVGPGCRRWGSTHKTETYTLLQHTWKKLLVWNGQLLVLINWWGRQLRTHSWNSRDTKPNRDPYISQRRRRVKELHVSVTELAGPWDLRPNTNKLQQLDPAHFDATMLCT